MAVGSSVTFISSACVKISGPGFSVLCDPWLTDGAFEGSWYHNPPLGVGPADLQDITHIYVSHLHPDHFDPIALAQLPRVPVLLCESEGGWLRRQVERLGLPSIPLHDGESISLGGAEVTMYGAFTANPLVTTQIPNLLDSSLVIQTEDGYSIFNANDNTPDAAACGRLRARHGRFDMALLPYSGASEYPSCFDNLDDRAKDRGAQDKIERYLTRLEENVRDLLPKRVMPFAGQYRLAGPVAPKDRYSGVPPVEAALPRIMNAGSEPILLSQLEAIELQTGERIARDIPVPTVHDPSAYWYDDAFSFPGDAHRIDLLPLLTAARRTLWRYQQRFGWAEPYRIVLEVRDGYPGPYVFDYASEDVVALKPGASPDPPYLRIRASYGLLVALLTRHIVWNNAALGCHLNFYREPEVYVPEVWTLTSFLHV